MSAPTTAPRVIYQRPRLLTDRPSHYCPGCGHGIVHRLIAVTLVAIIDVADLCRMKDRRG